MLSRLLIRSLLAPLAPRKLKREQAPRVGPVTSAPNFQSKYARVVCSARVGIIWIWAPNVAMKVLGRKRLDNRMIARKGERTSRHT
eukprot:1582296-Pyramimonas_sp.AAC.1